ncbi:AI-2E family transporter [Acetivibrio mesophilus]|jgi:predicted PurR-regulated permease PerM|uniref:AI-2E family transporter n=1 Tax=Acetivibrio mesophilus TaxID=2487273 RepID=A0A4V1K1V4_9FIRM|nr:AI-2E family transporter [Acetivibrio mesophilus]ODM28008.1 AI-2E family transporter [Clostridium sp. Bc-iso-3]RXE58099.1 AI-2E family transporter [Acetivibrio mesophilus]HHV28008.1 AI-2E family transporter [Clostridium sp.]
MVSTRKIFTYIILFLLGILITYFGLTYTDKIEKIIFPLVMGAVIAYILRPIVLKLESKNIPRTRSIILIYLAFGIVLTTAVVFIAPIFVNSTREFINTIPEITTEYGENFNNILKTIDTSDWSEEVKNAIYNEINNGVNIAENMLMDALRKSLMGFLKSVTGISNIILAMIIAYYIMKDAEFFKKGALSLVPRRWRKEIIGASREINDILSCFIQGQLLTAFIIGVMETIALTIIGVKYSPILGLMGGISNIIPYFGPFIGAIPSVAVALIDSPMKAVWTVLAFLIIQQIDNAFISPKIIEGRIGLHPVTTILAVLVGGEFFGIIGMLVAVPVTAVLKVILKRFVEAIV